MLALSGPAVCMGLAACGERHTQLDSCDSANRYGLEGLEHSAEFKCVEVTMVRFAAEFLLALIAF